MICLNILLHYMVHFESTKLSSHMIICLEMKSLFCIQMLCPFQQNYQILLKYFVSHVTQFSNLDEVKVLFGKMSYLFKLDYLSLHADQNSLHKGLFNFEIVWCDA